MRAVRHIAVALISLALAFVPAVGFAAMRATQHVMSTGAQEHEETTVHFHGVRLPNAMDGVPHLTQRPTAPGETFTYEFDERVGSAAGFAGVDRPAAIPSRRCDRSSTRPASHPSV